MDTFNYRVRFNNCPAKCKIEVYRGQHSALVIATELPDNPGTSVCNAFEDLILQVSQAYNLDPARLLWIEHWEDWDESRGAPYDREEDEWSRVKFDWDGEKATNPRWLYVSQSFVEAAKLML